MTIWRPVKTCKNIPNKSQQRFIIMLSMLDIQLRDISQPLKELLFLRAVGGHIHHWRYPTLQEEAWKPWRAVERQEFSTWASKSSSKHALWHVGKSVVWQRHGRQTVLNMLLQGQGRSYNGKSKLLPSAECVKHTFCRTSRINIQMQCGFWM